MAGGRLSLLRDTLRRQASNGGHVSRQPVDFGDEYRTPGPTGGGRRGGELRPTFQRVSTVAGLVLLMLGHQAETIGFGEGERFGPACRCSRE
jgi:hypothetical protein